jgi:hypothetical protein
LPKRTPLAFAYLLVRTVIKVGVPSVENHEFPGPSLPAGHNTFVMLLKPDSDDDGFALISAVVRGRGTSEDEKGDAPLEYGTFGLLVLFLARVLDPYEVTNDPPKYKLDPEELGTIERTDGENPDKPTKAAGDHRNAFVSKIATEPPYNEPSTPTGAWNAPPTQTFPVTASQYNASTVASNPEPKATNFSEVVLYDAMLGKGIPDRLEKLPATYRLFFNTQAAVMDPPTLVEPKMIRVPLAVRERRAEVEGSKTEVELLNTSSPANEPVRATLPMRLKSTFGTLATTTLMTRTKTAKGGM